MKVRNVAFAIACILSITGACLAQESEAMPQNPAGILGYLNPKTGAFRPFPTQATSPSEIPAASPTTGKFVFNIKIAVNAGLSTSAKIVCGATVSVADATSAATFEDEAVVAATRSGSAASCTVTIPYGWTLASASKDTVGMVVTVGSTSGSLATPPGSLGTSTQSFVIAVPASGATTTETISTSI